MNKIVIVLLWAALLSSCNNNRKDKMITPADTTFVPSANPDSSLKADLHYYWAAEFRGKKGWVMTKTTRVNDDSLNAGAMIDRLNALYPEIKLEYVNVTGDTLFLKIPDSRYLAREMGSSGGEAYLGEVTYNITEVPGINFVAFNFKKGDHAEAGVYSRTDFIYPR